MVIRFLHTISTKKLNAFLYHRHCSEKYLKSLNEEIDNAAGLDSRYFWKLVNTRRKNSTSNVGAELKFNGQVFRDSQTICDQWGRYLSELYSYSENENFDSTHFNYVTERVDELKQQTIDENDIVPVTLHELDNAISQLSKGKACGNDEIDNEHICFSGSTVRKLLVTLYNSMLLKSYIPESMKVGIIIPLYKGGSKRKDDPGSYMAITLTSCVLKLYERILLKRIMSTQKPFHPLQGGFQKGMGCTMTSFLVNESVQYAKENNSKLYICFLDAKKAFDKVWHDGLLLKFYERGIDLYIWKVLVSLHANLTSYVLFRGHKSNQFNIKRGSRQGGVISPFGFLCFIDDLLHQLTMSNIGLRIGSINVCCPTVADDMLLQALTKIALQILIDICVHYFHLWRLEYNALKCNVLVCNETDAAYKRSNRQWKLGNANLSETDKYTHLGIVCTKKMDVKANIVKASSQIRIIFFGLISSSFSEQDLNPLTWKRIYKTIVLPKALYGCELWSNMSQTDMLLLERSHRLCLKTMQGIGRYTRTYITVNLLGSLNVQFEIEKPKTSLLGQLCRLDPHFAVKRLFLHWLINHYLFHQLRTGFIVDVFRILEEYDLGYVLTEYITSGTFQSRHSWKKLIRNKLSDACDSNVGLANADEAVCRFQTIHPESKPCYFWELSRKHPYMLTACKSVVQMIALTFSKYQPIITCSACGSLVTKYVDHCVLWCPTNAGVRNRMWLGFWHKYGVDAYLRLASYDHERLIDVFFGRYELIADVIDIADKEAFYCYIARFIHMLKRGCSLRW